MSKTERINGYFWATYKGSLPVILEHANGDWFCIGSEQYVEISQYVIIDETPITPNSVVVAKISALNDCREAMSQQYADKRKFECKFGHLFDSKIEQLTQTLKK